MSKSDLVRKLTSRKFWLALVAFISALLVAFNVDAGSVEQITSIIMSFGALIAYILAEGWVDANRTEGAVNNEDK